MRLTGARRDSSKRSTAVARALQDRVAEAADERHGRRAARLDLGIERGAVLLPLGLHLRLVILPVLARPFEFNAVDTGGRGPRLLGVDVDGEARRGVLALARNGLDGGAHGRDAPARSRERTTSWARWRA